MTSPTPPIELAGAGSRFGEPAALPDGVAAALAAICPTTDVAGDLAETSRDWWPMALIAIGLALLLFEFFTAGVGVAGSTYISGTNYPIYPNDMPQSAIQIQVDRSGRVAVFSGGAAGRVAVGGGRAAERPRIFGGGGGVYGGGNEEQEAR